MPQASHETVEDQAGTAGERNHVGGLTLRMLEKQQENLLRIARGDREIYSGSGDRGTQGMGASQSHIAGYPLDLLALWLGVAGFGTGLGLGGLFAVSLYGGVGSVLAAVAQNGSVSGRHGIKIKRIRDVEDFF
jgi:hypothetical protein